MDSITNATEVFGSECITHSDRILVQSGKWKAVELELTLEKLRWLWTRMSAYRSLFNDLTRGSVENFYAVMSLTDSFWLEIQDSEDHVIGLVYWTGMSQIIDCDVHMMFLDHRPAEKKALCLEIAKWFFTKYPQYHRMTATLPETYRATIRLAMKIGFKWEGRKRQSQLMQGARIDEVVLGLLASEVL
jgi:hypothetical protein